MQELYDWYSTKSSTWGVRMKKKGVVQTNVIKKEKQKSEIKST